MRGGALIRFFFRTLEDAHSGREVVDPPRSPQSGGAHGGGGDEIVSERVVQVALGRR